MLGTTAALARSAQGSHAGVPGQKPVSFNGRVSQLCSVVCSPLTNSEALALVACGPVPHGNPRRNARERSHSQL